MNGRFGWPLAALLACTPVALGAQVVDSSYLQLVEWRSVGPTRGGRVLAVAGDPANDLVFYQGTAGGGVRWVSRYIRIAPQSAQVRGRTPSRYWTL